MNAPLSTDLLKTQAHHNSRVREIPYNYTSFSDKEITIRFLGEEIWNNLSKNTILYDLIYTPRPTQWLKLGKKKDCITLDGLEMLVHQGALSLKLWSGLDDIPIEIMKLSAKTHLMN